MNVKDLFSNRDRRGFLRRATQLVIGGGIAAGAGAAAAATPESTSPVAGDGSDAIWSPRGLEPFIGEILMVGFNFAPRGWAMCEGQLLSIASNTALFSLLGTTYGGDGRTTFGLPDLRGRFPMHAGSGPGLTSRRLGDKGGSETTTLTTNQMPSHAHGLSNLGDVRIRGGGSQIRGIPEGTDEGSSSLGATSDVTGGGQPHSNMPPFQCVNFVIALQGIFPSRS